MGEWTCVNYVNKYYCVCCYTVYRGQMQECSRRLIFVSESSVKRSSKLSGIAAVDEISEAIDCFVGYLKAGLKVSRGIGVRYVSPVFIWLFTRELCRHLPCVCATFRIPSCIFDALLIVAWWIAWTFWLVWIIYRAVDVISGLFIYTKENYTMLYTLSAKIEPFRMRDYIIILYLLTIAHSMYTYIWKVHAIVSFIC